MTIDQTSHITKRYDDGTTCEEYYHNGLLDRPDGPAIIWRWVDGSTSKEYFREGKFVNKEGLAAQSAIPAKPLAGQRFAQNPMGLSCRLFKLTHS
jgi:hypothetical protein